MDRIRAGLQETRRNIWDLEQDYPCDEGASIVDTIDNTFLKCSQIITREY